MFPIYFLGRVAVSLRNAGQNCGLVVARYDVRIGIERIGVSDSIAADVGFAIVYAECGEVCAVFV